MNRHNRPNSPEERICLEFISQIDRNQTSLPVMTVNDIRTETNQRKHGKNCFVKECKFFNIIAHVPIRNKTVKVFLIINKVIGNSIQLILKDTHILIPDIGPTGHIKMGDIFKLITEMLRNTAVIRDYYPDIPVFRIK